MIFEIMELVLGFFVVVITGTAITLLLGSFFYTCLKRKSKEGKKDE